VTHRTIVRMGAHTLRRAVLMATDRHRGRARDDIRPGLRTIGYRRRVIIAFAVIGQDVLIVGVFYGGRDYEAILTEPEVASD
jgi:toxin ParE1/3/4